MGNAQLVIDVDIEPATYKLEEARLYTAGKGILIRSANLVGVKPETKIVWSKLENVWYDICILDIVKKAYWLKGKYVTKKTVVKLSDIIPINLPASY